jgi:Holliday junction resolvasome RuvABC endonuclease subunit
MSVILGLDVSSVKTGWAVLKNGRFYKREGIDYGTIETSNKNNISNRLFIFRNELEKILRLIKPDTIIVEDTHLSKFVNALKMLVRFGAVAQELSWRVTSIDPLLVPVKLARTVIGSQDKEEVFNLVVEKYKLKDFKFSTHNDITDAIILTLYGKSIEEK